MKAGLILFLFFLISIITYGNPYSGKNNTEEYSPYAEIMPEPVGGMKTVFAKLNYPVSARETGLEGKVYLLVYINESGNVDEIKVVKGLDKDCDIAAIEAVKRCTFSPGKSNGAPVKVKLSMKIEFKLVQN